MNSNGTGPASSPGNASWRGGRAAWSGLGVLVITGGTAVAGIIVNLGTDAVFAIAVTVMLVIALTCLVAILVEPTPSPGLLWVAVRSCRKQPQHMAADADLQVREARQTRSTAQTAPSPD
ncbi:MAG: hypothetical protein HKP61_09645 [Dactylosporangium sp.]|nr:hypothetical protein [Dactylosporangium sp.]NNJ61195.1 hypothetical protein [Dactylosporangium sp.]